MMVNRRGLTLAAAVLMFSSVLVAQKPDDKKQTKQTDQQKKETLDIVKLADAAATGTMANDLGLAWAHEDYLKATGNKEYVPFTITYDPAKISAPNVALYWRVVAKDAAAPVATLNVGKKDDKDNKDKKAPSKYAYEDINFLAPGMGRLSRAFTVPAGTYDVYVVLREQASTAKNAPAPKVSIVKQTITVPDFWTPELTTSSVILAQRIEPLNAPLSPNEQVERPYALGQMEIVPSLDAKFTTKQELSVFMLIYNPKTDPMNKPDVSVEYNFYAKPAGAAEKFFNKTSPQDLNAKTLPAAFDMSLGHQLQTGQSVPLASFAPGDYRLEIKITDKLATKTVTRDVNFTVTAG